MIKIKDPRLVRIDVAVKGFFTSHPPKGTQVVKLTAQKVDELIQAEEEPMPSEEEQEEITREPSFVDLEEDFEVFNR